LPINFDSFGRYWSTPGAEVCLVESRPLTPAEEDAFRAAVIENFGFEFRFRFVYVADIPRAPSGKYFVFRSELPG